MIERSTIERFPFGIVQKYLKKKEKQLWKRAEFLSGAKIVKSFNLNNLALKGELIDS